MLHIYYRIYESSFGLAVENALQFERKLIPAKCRGAVAILSVPQSGQPPAVVFHREGIKNGSLRSDEFGCELPSLFRGNRGIEKNKMVCASPHIFRRDGLRRREGQFAPKFFEGPQHQCSPGAVPADQQNVWTRYGDCAL